MDVYGCIDKGVVIHLSERFEINLSAKSHDTEPFGNRTRRARRTIPNPETKSVFSVYLGPKNPIISYMVSVVVSISYLRPFIASYDSHLIQFLQAFGDSDPLKTHLGRLWKPWGNMQKGCGQKQRLKTHTHTHIYIYIYHSSSWFPSKSHVF